MLDPDLVYVPINDLFVMIDDRPETRQLLTDPEALAEFFRDHWPEKLVEPTVDEEKDPQAWEEFQRHAEWEENRDYGEITEQLERLKDRLALTAQERAAIRAGLIRVLPGPDTQYQASLWLSAPLPSLYPDPSKSTSEPRRDAMSMPSPDESQIDWAEALEEDQPSFPIKDGLILNKDKRYAMSIDPALLVDASGRRGYLLAQGSTGTQEPVVWFGD